MSESNLNFLVFVCVCGVCMYVHMCVGAHMYKGTSTPVHVYVCEGLKLTSSVFLDYSLPYLLRQGLSLKPLCGIMAAVSAWLLSV